MATPLRLLRDGRGRAGDASQTDVDRLFAGVAAGDARALNALLEIFWTPLINYASRLLNDFDAADDVVLDVFVRIWVRRHEWNGSSVRGLLFSLTRNAALDELRRRGSRARLARANVRGGLPAPRTPAELLERDETSAAVDRAVQELPCKRREVFDLVYLRGLSYQDAAQIMGISVKTVGNQMTAALRQLRTTLQPLVMEPPPTPLSPAVRPSAPAPPLSS